MSSKMLSDLIHQYVRVGNTNGIAAKVAEVMDDPKNSYRMADLIELLEPSLTGSDEKERNQATSLLAELFEIKDISLSSPELHIFTIFFCRRVTDFPSLYPALLAIQTFITKYDKLYDVKYCDILDILISITKNIHVPSYAQNIRQKVLDIVNQLVSNRLFFSTIEPSNKEIIENILNAVEDEKDPRCLLQGLQILIQIQNLFPDTMTLPLTNPNATESHRITSMISDDLDNDSDDEMRDNAENAYQMTIIESIFDYLCCYFPISFTPPPDDPFGITPEQLSKVLQDCFTVSTSMLPFTVPFFLHQIIQQETEGGKIAAIDTLQALINKYSIHTCFSRKIHVDDDDDHQHHNHGHNDSGGGKQAGGSGCCGGSGKKGQGDGCCSSKTSGEESCDQVIAYAYVANLIYDILLTEGSNTLVQATSTFLYFITQQISTTILTHVKEYNTYSVAWEECLLKLLTKGQFEIMNQLESFKATLAWKMILIIHYTCDQNYLLSPLIIKQFVPFLLTKATHTLSVFQQYEQTYFFTSYKAISFFNTHKFAVKSIEMLQEFLQTGSSTANTLSSSISVSQIDRSHLQAMNPWKEYIPEIFQLLKKFIQPVEIDISNATTHGMTKPIPPEDEYSNPIDSEMVECIVLSINTMKALLKRTQGEGISSNEIVDYCLQVNGLLLYGLESRVTFVNTATGTRLPCLTNTSDSTKETILPYLSFAKENQKIFTTCQQFFLDLMTIHTSFQDQLLTAIFPQLIKQVFSCHSVDENNKHYAHDLSSLVAQLIQLSDGMEWMKLWSNECSLLLNDENNLTAQQTALPLTLYIYGAIFDVSASYTKKIALFNLQTKAAFLLEKKDGVSDSMIVKIVCTVIRILLKESQPGYKPPLHDELLSSLFTLIRHFMTFLPDYATQDKLCQAIFKQLVVVYSVSASLEWSRISHGLMLNLFTNMQKQCQVFQDHPVVVQGTLSVENFEEENISAVQYAMLQLSDFEKYAANGLLQNEDITTIAQCLAIIVNKLHDKIALQGILDRVLSLFMISGANNRQKVVPIFLWTWKAVILRPIVPISISSTNKIPSTCTNWQDLFTTMFFQICHLQESEPLQSQSVIINSLVQNLSILLQDHPIYLPKVTSATSSSSSVMNYSLFWHQKLFFQWYAFLSKEIEDTKKLTVATDTSSLQNINIHQIQLMIWFRLYCQILRYTPYSILCTVTSTKDGSLESGMPILAEEVVTIFSYLHNWTKDPVSSTSPAFNMIAALEQEALSTIQLFFHHRKSSDSVTADWIPIFANHLHLLIPRLLQACQQKLQPLAKSRAVALECLKDLPQYVSYPTLHPFRKTVTKELVKALDDNKRAVRQLAATVRNEWLLLE